MSILSHVTVEQNQNKQTNRELSANSILITLIMLARVEEERSEETQRCKVTILFLKKFWGGYDELVFLVFPTNLTLRIWLEFKHLSHSIVVRDGTMPCCTSLFPRL